MNEPTVTMKTTLFEGTPFECFVHQLEILAKHVGHPEQKALLDGIRDLQSQLIKKTKECDEWHAVADRNVARANFNRQTEQNMPETT